jgi:hypothetical protein
VQLESESQAFVKKKLIRLWNQSPVAKLRNYEFATAGVGYCYWLDLDGVVGWIWTLLLAGFGRCYWLDLDVAVADLDVAGDYLRIVVGFIGNFGSTSK